MELGSAGVREGRIIVISTDPESQGEKVGVIPGDLLIKVNDQVVSAADIESVRNVLRSNENRTVQLNLMRDNDHVEVNVRLRELKPATMTQLHENIGIIHFSEVALGTDDEFTAAMNDLVNQGAASFILDLRDTPSGLLTESVSIIYPTLFRPVRRLSHSRTPGVKFGISHRNQGNTWKAHMSGRPDKRPDRRNCRIHRRSVKRCGECDSRGTSFG